MAFPLTAGDRVVFRDHITGQVSDTMPILQPPHLGFVEGGSDPITVLWDNAERNTNIPNDDTVSFGIGIPLLRTAPPSSSALLGQNVSNGNSPEFAGMVYALLGIELVLGSGTFIDYAVIRTHSGGMFYYYPAAGLVVTP